MLTRIEQAALKYIAQGYPVIPICWTNPDGTCACGCNHNNGNAGKAPVTPHGLKDATLTQIGVKAFWKQYPKANVAIVIPPGMFVLDIDINHNGFESLEKLQNKIGDLPDTLRITTGSGGCHLWYKTPTPLRNTTRLDGLEGLDIRGQGGYVVAPPSMHKTGNPYVVADNYPIPEAPQALIQLCLQKVPESVASDGEPITEGQRNQSLTSLAGTMRRRGMTETAIAAALMAVNKEQCKPPLTEQEINTIAKSVSRYKPDELSDIHNEILTNDKISDITDTTDKPTRKTEEKLTELTSTDKSLTSTDTARGKVIWKLIDTWLAMHKGERFDLDTLCRQLDIKTRDDRHEVTKKLSYEVTRKKIEKSVNVRPPIYRPLDNTVVKMDWVNATTPPQLNLKWPAGIDNTHFGYENRIYIPSKGLIVIAGVTNTGKSVWCRNFLWRNMNNYHCVYFSSETSSEDFHDYASRMTWANPLDKKGNPVFDLIDRNKDFKDVIQPDSINIVDWLNIGDNFYQIGAILEGIKEKLNKGIAVIALQKDPAKELGTGGMWSEHLSSLYMTLDYGRMTVKKAKKWYEWNPNGHTWGFDIVDRGTHLSNIRLLKRCGYCWNGKKNNTPCKACGGTGFVESDKK